MEEELLEQTEIVESVEQTTDETTVEADELDGLTPEELKQRYKELEEKNKNAEAIAKKIKNEKSQSKRAEIEQSKSQEIEAKRNEFVTSEIENILNSNMQITEEQLATAKELGMSQEQLKLMAYETKERLNAIYEEVGGKETYFNMVEAVKETASEEDVVMFREALSNPKTSKIALEALKYRYANLSTNNDVQVDNRIKPTSTAESNVSSYKSMQEYQSDMRKMRTLPSMQQQAFYSKIQDKLNRSNLV